MPYTIRHIALRVIQQFCHIFFDNKIGKLCAVDDS